MDPPECGSSSGAFDPLRLLRTLSEHGVAFVVIGDVAARTHGSPSLTQDLDICYERSRPNLEALVRTLKELHARLRGVEPDLPFQLDVRTLELSDNLPFVTDAGDLDCLGTPDGTRGFADLARQAVRVEIDTVEVKIASLDDVMRMKWAAGRPKDRIELEILTALREELGLSEG